MLAQIELKYQLMSKKIFLIILFFICEISISQETKHPISLGFNYGFGGAFENKDYSFSNRFFKLQCNYTVSKTKKMEYQIVLQPEINFATHQLKNFYFIKPEEPDFLTKRNEYTKLKDIHEYVFGVGFLARKWISKSCSLYVLASVGPMITNTDTERLTKGFAFSDVISIGFSFKINKTTIDIRPSLRHNSNAGLQRSNAGLNTRNIEFGLSIPLKN